MIVIKTSAKINLYLRVMGKRPDGYHQLETLYQPVSLYDRVELNRRNDGVGIEGNHPSVPWNETNICVKAARRVMERAGLKKGVDIRVSKGIPAGAGLGGGSSNAAATIVGINILYRLNLSREELINIGSEVGSDVPFFIYGRPAVGRGRGDLLQPAAGLSGGYVLIVKPDVSVSTRWAYRKLNKVLTSRDSGNRLNVLKAGLAKFPEVKLNSCNSFEEVATEAFPEIREVLNELREEDAILCAMSGSGSACFAVFSEERKAQEALERQTGRRKVAEITRPVNRTMELPQED